MVDTVVLRHHRCLQLRLGQAMLPKGGDTKSGKIALDATLRNVGASLSDPTKGRKGSSVKEFKPRLWCIKR